MLSIYFLETAHYKGSIKGNEEAPAINIPDEKINEIYQISVNACCELNYEGAGTLEFLYENGEFSSLK